MKNGDGDTLAKSVPVPVLEFSKKVIILLEKFLFFDIISINKKIEGNKRYEINNGYLLKRIRKRNKKDCASE